jgi:hypothetical protein
MLTERCLSKIAHFEPAVATAFGQEACAAKDARPRHAADAACSCRRQAGAKLPGLCLPRCCSCMVDLMSLDPNLIPLPKLHESTASTVVGLRSGG